MSEPVNPLFEEEKEFLERKKLEYERALRGDVEHIKDQTVQVGKVALVGVGIAGSIWLLSKVFGRRKRSEWHHAEAEASYEDDFSGFGEDNYRDYDGPDYEAPATGSHWSRYADQEESTLPSAFAADDLDDNGLSESPDFEAHSTSQHGSDDYQRTPDSYASGDETDDNESSASRPFWSAEHSHPSANLPYDDSRRMPESNSFASDSESASPAPSKKSWVGPAVISFLQSETGRVIAAQAAAVVLALVTKAVKDVLPSDEVKATKSSDLAASTAVGARPYGQPAAKAAPQSPVSDAKDPDTDTTYHSLA